MLITTGLMARNRESSRKLNTINSAEREIKGKPYVASKWARDMVNAANSMTNSRGEFKPSGSFLRELDRKGGLKQVPKHSIDELKKKTHEISQGKE